MQLMNEMQIALEFFDKELKEKSKINDENVNYYACAEIALRRIISQNRQTNHKTLRTGTSCVALLAKECFGIVVSSFIINRIIAKIAVKQQIGVTTKPRKAAMRNEKQRQKEDRKDRMDAFLVGK